MGNERSNSYWEANLPPNYDRDGIENFIRAKYEDKRWVAKEGREIPPPAPIVQQQEEKTPVQWQRPAAKISLPMPPKEPFGFVDYLKTFPIVYLPPPPHLESKTYSKTRHLYPSPPHTNPSLTKT